MAEDERRSERRVPVLADGFTVEVREPTGSELAVLDDLSEHGMGLKMKHALPVGSRIAVEVRADTGTKVVCIAKVCHVHGGSERLHPFKLGLQLIQLNAVQELALKTLLKVAREKGAQVTDLNWLD